jgi:hypothetical protein
MKMMLHPDEIHESLWSPSQVPIELFTWISDPYQNGNQQPYDMGIILFDIRSMWIRCEFAFRIRVRSEVRESKQQQHESKHPRNETKWMMATWPSVGQPLLSLQMLPPNKNCRTSRLRQNVKITCPAEFHSDGHTFSPVPFLFFVAIWQLGLQYSVNVRHLVSTLTVSLVQKSRELQTMPTVTSLCKHRQEVCVFCDMVTSQSVDVC